MSMDNNLANLRAIKDGWDGRGSAAPTKEALATAANISACPLGYGGIQLEIHAGGADIEIEIGADGHIIMVAWEKSPK